MVGHNCINGNVSMVMCLFYPPTNCIIEDHIDILPSMDVNAQLLPNLVVMIKKAHLRCSIQHHCCNQPLEIPVNLFCSLMHSEFSFSKTVEAYKYDYSSDRAIWAIALINYWVTHAFKIANCNGFHFDVCPLGLSPNGTMGLSMVLYDPHTALYIHNNENISMFADVNAQILYFLFGLMDYLQPNLQYTRDCCNTRCNRIP